MCFQARTRTHILKMSKHIKTDQITALTNIWMNWMENYDASNNPKKSYAERRQAGEACEHLQAERQKIITDINDGIN